MEILKSSLIGTAIVVGALLIAYGFLQLITLWGSGVLYVFAFVGLTVLISLGVYDYREFQRNYRKVKGNGKST
jgi:hypothetical protein